MMEINETLNVAVAEYRFGCNNIFEDIINGQESLHLNNISLGGEFGILPIPLEYKVAFEHQKESIQKMLEVHAENLCKNLNMIDKDLQYRRVHLDCLNRVHSAMMCYRFIGEKFEAYKLFVWYIIETMELEGFLRTEVEKRFSYMKEQ